MDSSKLFLAVVFVATVRYVASEVGSYHSVGADLLAARLDSESAFLQFLSMHGKNYTSRHQFIERLRVFESNVAMAIENQLNDPTAVHGITQFFDLSEDEFAAQYLGVRTVPKDDSLTHPDAPILPTDDLPDEIDWREKGAVTAIKNQGSCGSCYAFSAIGALEGAHFLKTGELVSLSEQQVVDCDHTCDPSYHNVCDSGCNGGLMNNVVNYVIKSGGVAREDDYKYTGRDGSCQFNGNQFKVAAGISSYQVVGKDEKQIAANLVKYGPLAVAINAAWMQSYVRGVSCPLLCNKKALDHGVLLVGYGQSDYSIARLKKKPYWIIKNSWGPHWGEEGYYKVCSGQAMCGVNTMVTSVVASDVKFDSDTLVDVA